jgi:predicted P-loop ATPase
MQSRGQGPVVEQFLDKLNLKESLRTSRETGAVLPLDSNIEKILAEHPACGGALTFDEFKQDICQIRPLPATLAGYTHKLDRSWTDVDATRLGNWICDQYSFNVPRDKVHAQCEALAKKNSYHPVRGYLQALTWDGKPRLASLFSRYFGAKDSAYMQAVSRMFMIGAVARVMRPGCKLDTAPILVGKQGAGSLMLEFLLHGPFSTL